MKRFFFTLVLISILSSCQQYQYITLESDIFHNELQNFAWENDTLKIQYSFSGQNCPLKIQIENKLKQPIFIDWSKSAVIYEDGSSFPLWDNNSYVNTVSTGAGLNVGNIAISETQTNGTINRPPQIAFIPPYSHITYNPVYIRSALIRPLDKTLKQRVTFGFDDASKVDLYKFTPENSPFSFRCFVTASTSEKFTTSIYIDNPFWVSSIIETKRNPNEFLKNDNLFYVNKTTAMGHILGGVGVASLLVGTAYIQVATTPHYDDYHHH
jgi:hypothetical protein